MSIEALVGELVHEIVVVEIFTIVVSVVFVSTTWETGLRHTEPVPKESCSVLGHIIIEEKVPTTQHSLDLGLDHCHMQAPSTVPSG